MKASRVVCVVVLAAIMLAGLLYIGDCIWINSTVALLMREASAGDGEITAEASPYVSPELYYNFDFSWLDPYDGAEVAPDAYKRDLGMMVSAHCFTKGAAFFNAGGVVATVWLEFRDGHWHVTDVYVP
jgi:hypothetical protein